MPIQTNRSSVDLRPLLTTMSDFSVDSRAPSFEFTEKDMASLRYTARKGRLQPRGLDVGSLLGDNMPMIAKTAVPATRSQESVVRFTARPELEKFLPEMLKSFANWCRVKDESPAALQDTPARQSSVQPHSNSEDSESLFVALEQALETVEAQAIDTDQFLDRGEMDADWLRSRSRQRRRDSAEVARAVRRILQLHVLLSDALEVSLVRVNTLLKAYMEHIAWGAVARNARGDTAERRRVINFGLDALIKKQMNERRVLVVAVKPPLRTRKDYILYEGTASKLERISEKQCSCSENGKEGVCQCPPKQLLMPAHIVVEPHGPPGVATSATSAEPIILTPFTIAYDRVGCHDVEAQQAIFLAALRGLVQQVTSCALNSVPDDDPPEFSLS